MIYKKQFERLSPVIAGARLRLKSSGGHIGDQKVGAAGVNANADAVCPSSRRALFPAAVLCHLGTGFQRREGFPSTIERWKTVESQILNLALSSGSSANYPLSPYLTAVSSTYCR